MCSRLMSLDVSITPVSDADLDLLVSDTARVHRERDKRLV